MLLVNTITDPLFRFFSCKAKRELAVVKKDLAEAIRRAEWAEDAWRKAAGFSGSGGEDEA
jgi:hypothetical protein